MADLNTNFSMQIPMLVIVTLSLKFNIIGENPAEAGNITDAAGVMIDLAYRGKSCPQF